MNATKKIFIGASLEFVATIIYVWGHHDLQPV